MRISRAILVACALAGSAAGQSQPAESNDLEAEMHAAAAELSSELPVQVDSITRVVAIRAEGTEFIYDLEISQAIPADQVEAIANIMQQTNQQNLCASADVSPFVRQGGSMRHRYVDPVGHHFETRITACPD